MSVDEDEAVSVMRRLAYPADGDPAVVAGESGEESKSALRLDPQARVAAKLR